MPGTFRMYFPQYRYFVILQSCNKKVYESFEFCWYIRPRILVSTVISFEAQAEKGHCCGS